jgi:hypothetical protein
LIARSPTAEPIDVASPTRSSTAKDASLHARAAARLTSRTRMPQLKADGSAEPQILLSDVDTGTERIGETPKRTQIRINLKPGRPTNGTGFDSIANILPIGTTAQTKHHSVLLEEIERAFGPGPVLAAGGYARAATAKRVSVGGKTVSGTFPSATVVEPQPALDVESNAGSTEEDSAPVCLPPTPQTFARTLSMNLQSARTT